MSTLFVRPVEGRRILNPDDNFSVVDKPIEVFSTVFWRGAVRDGDLEIEPEDDRKKRLADEEQAQKDAKPKKEPSDPAPDNKGAVKGR